MSCDMAPTIYAAADSYRHVVARTGSMNDAFAISAGESASARHSDAMRLLDILRTPVGVLRSHGGTSASRTRLEGSPSGTK